jgi:hypothetical protein
MNQLLDHGLPLVQLKEQRRDLVVSLQRHVGGSISGWQLLQIAALQQAIGACEEVMADLDAEVEGGRPQDPVEANVVYLHELL